MPDRTAIFDGAHEPQNAFREAFDVSPHPRHAR